MFFSQPCPRGSSDLGIRNGINDRSIADGQIDSMDSIAGLFCGLELKGKRNEMEIGKERERESEGGREIVDRAACLHWPGWTSCTGGRWEIGQLGKIPR